MEPETARTIFWLLLLPFLALCYYDYRNEKRLISEGYYKKRRINVREAHKKNLLMRREQEKEIAREAIAAAKKAGL